MAGTDFLGLRQAFKGGSDHIPEALPLASFYILQAESSSVSIYYLIIGIVVLIIGLRLVRYLMTRDRRQGTTNAHHYGFLGGTLCPKCGRPFAIHWWSMRLIIKRLDRCPHCRKWSLVARVSPETLENSEKSMNKTNTEAGLSEPGSDAGKTARLLEESKYE